MRPPGALFPTIACCILVSVCQAADDAGAGVVRQMHAKYQDAWFTTTRFAQKTTTYDAQGKASVESWYERIQLPGKLRIDVGPVGDGNAMILSDGQMHTFKHGSHIDSRPLVSLALLLGFDVYQQSPEATLAQLRHEGVDTARMHEDSWQGRPVLVVGAERGDLRSTQFWVDKERLLVLRIIMPSRNEAQTPADIHFLDFRKQPRGMIAARIDVYRDERLVMSEEYSDIETDIPLEAAWFDASRLSTPASGMPPH
ncbi:MAG TPA: hypothetical protein VGI91_06550 [Steroidobacteraceae bacterium]|jgi:hypothetical protein